MAVDLFYNWSSYFRNRGNVLKNENKQKWQQQNGKQKALWKKKSQQYTFYVNIHKTWIFIRISEYCEMKTRNGTEDVCVVYPKRLEQTKHIVININDMTLL
jgi:hypothetical protein